MPALLLALLCLLLAPAWADPAAPPVDNVRVGVLSFEDVDQMERFKILAAAMREARARPSLAVGTYGELFHWLENDLVDVAVVTAGVYSRLDPNKWEALGTAGNSAEERASHSVILARKDQALNSMADLKAAGPSLQLLAVDPLSVTGFLNPVTALAKEGLVLEPDQLRFTHSHSNSIRYLAASTGQKIACVWESTWKRHPDASLKVVPIPALDHLHSPPGVLIGRAGTPLSARVAQLVRERKLPGFVWDPHYNESIRSLPRTPPSALSAYNGRPLDRVDLDDLVLTLRHYNRTHPTPARLAVVLAGGGAKCSYQAGAVRALEERLEAARRHYNDERLDIELVVGTSGGAINALAVAMGLTRTQEGYQDLRGAWCDLDQREIVCPPLAVRVNMWWWFACLSGLVVMSLIKLLRLKHKGGVALTGAAGLFLTFLPRMPIKPWAILGTDSNLQHMWAWFCRGLEGAGIIIFSGAVVGSIMVAAKRKRFTPVMLRIGIAGAALLPIVQLYTVFVHEEFLSENTGIEQALRRNFRKVISAESARRSASAGPVDPSLDIQALSREVFTRKLLQRDLVLTASPLTDPKLKLPGELYFWARSLASPTPDYGARGVELAQRPELLFDALLGSAAIYPLFPSRHIPDLPQAGQSLELVDGSFAHRSPLEAAVAWKATHVLIIDASTEEVASRGCLLDNFGASLSYLYDEAQLVDVRLRGKTALYTLYPSAPHIGLLDFSENLIKASLDKGYREAAGAPTSTYQRGGSLHKELGPPVFWTPE